MRWPWRSRSAEPPEATFGEVEHKAVLDKYYRTLARIGGGIGMSAGPWPVERAVTEGYERVIWVFKCVDTIARNSAKLDYRLKKGERIVTDHPLYRVLNDGKANELETGRQFRKRLSAQLLLSPRGAFVEVTKTRGGKVLRYDLLPPGRTVPIPGRPGSGVLLDHYEVTDSRTGRRRTLDPSRVRWLRDPHPLDPYRAITPLESMEMSVELDYFARLYNVAFLRHDGRPGGVLGVEGDMEDSDMDRIEAKFGRGPVEAGKLTVVGGKLTYVDTAARPRDMAYGELSKSAKEEILSGFGVDESVMGLTANRTYDNAEQAEFNFWSITMDAHNSLITSGLDEDSEDDLTGWLDTTGIQSLELPLRKRREEARLEVAAGLRSIISYAELAGIKGIASMPETRALLIPSGVAPLPTSEEDKEALAPAPQEEPSEELPAEEEEPTEDVEEAPEESDPLAILSGLADLKMILPAQPQFSYEATLKPRLLTKAPAGPSSAVPASSAAQSEQSDPGDPQARDNAEAALAAVLAAWAARRVAVTEARLKSPKVRKGTRYWTAESATDTRGGEAPLDAEGVVDPEAWAAEAEQAAEPPLRTIAEQAAALAVAALPVGSGGDDGAIAALVTAVVATGLAAIAAAARQQAETMVRLITDAEVSGATLEGLLTAVQSRSPVLAKWSAHRPIQVVSSTYEGSRSAVYGAARLAGLQKAWKTRGDDRVRPTHRAANGQRQAPGMPFDVGAALLRYPGDPLAPIAETASCRCTVTWHWTKPGSGGST